MITNKEELLPLDVNKNNFFFLQSFIKSKIDPLKLFKSIEEQNWIEKTQFYQIDS